MSLNFETFARLRPLMPIQALIEAAGAAWQAPVPEDEGYVSYKGTDGMPVCSAYLDVENRLHKICFYRSFPRGGSGEVYIGMPVQAALAARPGMCPIDGSEGEEWARRNIVVYRETNAVGDVIELRVRDDRLLAIELSCPGLIAPERPYKYADPRLTRASPPGMAEHPHLQGAPEPSWRLGYSAPAWLLRSQPDMASYMEGLARPIVIEEREDPNAGKPAREWDDENQFSGYVPAFSDEGQALGLDRFQAMPHHLGGTMIPVQGYPPFSPYYFEFGEEFACFNFGGGVGQVDLDQMEIDGACG